MSPIFLAADNQLMWTVTAAGISIVFAVLLLLVGIFYLFGVVMRKTGHKKPAAKPAKTQSQKKSAAAPQVTLAPKQTTAPQAAQDGIPLEVIAAISAAISEMEGGKAFAIRSIRKQQPAGARPVWAMAGVSDNTRPF